MDGQGAPAAKRRKAKNKFKRADAIGAAASQKAAPQPSSQPQLHATASGAARKKKKRKQRRSEGRGEADETVGLQADAPQQRPAPPPPAARPPLPAAAQQQQRPGLPSAGKGKKGKGGGSLLEQMRARLQGGRFRWLNEALYTSDGAKALAMVRREPELMQQYHDGFREQTKGWPVQPVDQAIAWLRRRPAGWAVADLGCGDARIAAACQPRQRVHSFDLAETAPGVVACNMADLPLADASVDAAVFCLSLMGTDYGQFIEEAARVLKPAGWLWVAEVQSRFVGHDGRSVLPAFEAALAALGFAVRRKDISNSHFLVLEAQRQGQHGGKGGKGGGGGGGRQQAAPAWPELRPCAYKKR